MRTGKIRRERGIQIEMRTGKTQSERSKNREMRRARKMKMERGLKIVRADENGKNTKERGDTKG